MKTNAYHGNKANMVLGFIGVFLTDKGGEKSIEKMQTEIAEEQIHRRLGIH